MKIRSCDDRSNLSVISYIKKALNKNLCISEIIILPIFGTCTLKHFETRSFNGGCIL